MMISTFAPRRACSELLRNSSWHLRDWGIAERSSCKRVWSACGSLRTQVPWHRIATGLLHQSKLCPTLAHTSAVAKTVVQLQLSTSKQQWLSHQQSWSARKRSRTCLQCSPLSPRRSIEVLPTPALGDSVTDAFSESNNPR